MRLPKPLNVFVIGLTLGFLIWELAALASNNIGAFENLDIYVQQGILALSALFVGLRSKFTELLLFFCGIYLGSICHSYFNGGAEQPDYFMLNLYISILFLMVPLFFGIMGYTYTWIKKNAPEPRS